MKVAGTAYFKIDGQQYSLKGSVNASLGGVSRESVVGLDGYHGIKETPTPAFIEIELTDRPEIDLNTLESLSNVTVTIELINGKAGVLRNAHQVNGIELNADEGSFTARFEGPAGEWLVNNG